FTSSNIFQVTFCGARSAEKRREAVRSILANMGGKDREFFEWGVMARAAFDMAYSSKWEAMANSSGDYIPFILGHRLRLAQPTSKVQVTSQAQVSKVHRTCLVVELRKPLTSRHRKPLHWGTGFQAQP